MTAGWTESFGILYSDFWSCRVNPDGYGVWSHNYGGSEGDEAYSVIQTDDGGFALAGWTDSFGAGSSDFWLCKTNSGGYGVLSNHFGGSNTESAHSVVQTGDGGYALAGMTRSYGEGGVDVWLVKTDSSGEKEWAKTFGGSDYEGVYSLIRTDDGGFAMAGYTQSFGHDDSDIWLIKTDSDGNEEWSGMYGGSSTDKAKQVVQTEDGGYALAGTTWSFDQGGGDFYLMKLANESATGHELSVSSEPAGGGVVTLNPPGGYYVDGVEVTVMAEATEGYVFNNWSGDLSGTDPSETLTMYSGRSVTAHFSQESTVDNTPPSEPSGLSISGVTDTSISLEWDDNPEEDLENYNIYRSGWPLFSIGPETFLDTTLSSDYSDTGLPENTTYYYLVTAVDNSGNESVGSDAVSATTAIGGENMGFALGDVDGSGGVDIANALQVARYDATLNPEPFIEAFADVVGCDGTVDILDALEIARYDAGLIDSFEC